MRFQKYFNRAVVTFVQMLVRQVSIVASSHRRQGGTKPLSASRAVESKLLHSAMGDYSLGTLHCVS